MDKKTVFIIKLKKGGYEGMKPEEPNPQAELFRVMSESIASNSEAIVDLYEKLTKLHIQVIKLAEAILVIASRQAKGKDL